MKSLSLTTLSLAAIAASSLTHADIVGDQSYDDDIEVGPSTVDAGPHNPDLPGIGVESDSYDKSQKVDFDGLRTALGGPDGNGVTTLNSPIVPPDHSGLGVFHFAEVGSSGVWFGEWSASGDVDDGTHAVYYVGEDGDTSVPTSGTVNYTVAGISDYSNNSLLTGQFQANFGTAKLTGSIDNGAGYEVDIGMATIHSNATFTGSTAFAEVNSNEVASGGDVKGQFFNSQSELAGFVRFDSADREYDTAFGGN